MLNAKLIRSYRSKKGNVTFVYGVSGSADNLAKFAAAQGDNHRTDEVTGTPLWFTTRCIGQAGTLIITSNDKVVPDMSAYDQADSLAKQYGGNLGQELAKTAAALLTGNANPVPTPQPTPTE